MIWARYRNIKSLFVLNADGGGNVRTIKANYYKMGVYNFLFAKGNGFFATAVMIEYDF